MSINTVGNKASPIAGSTATSKQPSHATKPPQQPVDRELLFMRAVPAQKEPSPNEMDLAKVAADAAEGLARQFFSRLAEIRSRYDGTPTGLTEASQEVRKEFQPRIESEMLAAIKDAIRRNRAA